MALSTEDIERRIAAKKNNERMKLIATTANNLSILTVFTPIISPIIQNQNLTLSPASLMAVALFLLFQFFAHCAISFLRSED